MLCEQDKEKWFQDWALGIAEAKGSFVWFDAINCDCLSSTWN